MWRGIDKRKFPRANYKCKVLIKKGRLPLAFSTQTENIGIGGICVILQKPLDIFSEVDLEIFLEQKDSPLKCKGSIVWVVRRATFEKEKPAIYDTGIEFLDLKDEDRVKIETIINEILSKTKEE